LDIGDTQRCYNIDTLETSFYLKVQRTFRSEWERMKNKARTRPERIHLMRSTSRRTIGHVLALLHRCRRIVGHEFMFALLLVV
jgi:hypothetical protein